MSHHDESSWGDVILISFSLLDNTTAANKLREHKPSFVANYTKTAYWAVASDRNCTTQAAQLEECKFSLFRCFFTTCHLVLDNVAARRRGSTE